MSLLFRGAQDVLLTGEPEASLFRSVYSRASNFGMETVKIPFNVSGNARVPRKGDLLGKCYLTITDLNGNLYTPTTWIDFFDTIDFYIGNQLIDSQDAIYSTKIWPVVESANISQNVAPGSFYPLHFFFCKDVSDALNLNYVKYQDVEFRIKSPKPGYIFYIWATFYYISTKDRELIPTEMIITQTQRMICTNQTDFTHAIGNVKYIAGTKYNNIVSTWQEPYILQNSITTTDTNYIVVSKNGKVIISYTVNNTFIKIYTDENFKTITTLQTGFIIIYASLSYDGGVIAISDGSSVKIYTNNSWISAYRPRDVSINYICVSNDGTKIAYLDTDTANMIISKYPFSSVESETSINAFYAVISKNFDKVAYIINDGVQLDSINVVTNGVTQTVVLDGAMQWNYLLDFSGDGNTLVIYQWGGDARYINTLIRVFRYNQVWDNGTILDRSKYYSTSENAQPPYGGFTAQAIIGISSDGNRIVIPYSSGANSIVYTCSNGMWDKGVNITSNYITEKHIFDSICSDISGDGNLVVVAQYLNTYNVMVNIPALKLYNLQYGYYPVINNLQARNLSSEQVFNQGFNYFVAGFGPYSINLSATNSPYSWCLEARERTPGLISITNSGVLNFSVSESTEAQVFIITIYARNSVGTSPPLHLLIRIQ
jgi:hypothetical protein